jgi:hypothetical protein
VTETPPSAVTLLACRHKEISDHAQGELSQAKLNSRGHWISGACGLLGSSVAAATSSFGPRVIPVIFGVLGALGSGMAAFFHLDRRAAGHERNSWKLQAVAEFAENRLADVQLLDPGQRQGEAAVKALDEIHTHRKELRLE